VITGACGFTVSASVALPVPPAFVAAIVTLLDPIAVAVPLIKPAVGSTLNPAGNPLAE
jgi:hypothetical protein